MTAVQVVITSSSPQLPPSDQTEWLALVIEAGLRQVGDDDYYKVEFGPTDGTICLWKKEEV